MKFPHLALLIVTTALAAWLAGVLYTWLLDPEMKFWTAASWQKLDWVEKMRGKHGYVIGVVGGSTTTFGIDAEHIEREHGLPVANLGLHVGMGPEACIGFGLSALKEGDTLVLSLEPATFAADHPGDSKLGSKLSFLLGRPEIVAWASKTPRLEFIKGLAMMPPGGYHAMTILGKVAMRLPAYRYSIENLRPGGLQVTEERRDFATGMDFSYPEKSPPLSKHGVQLLRNAQSAADQRGINLIYVLPWSYWPQETVAQRQAANAELLQAVGNHVAVLTEPAMGVCSELTNFTDSGQHLTSEAAAARSAILADTLKAARGSDSHRITPAEHYP